MKLQNYIFGMVIMAATVLVVYGMVANLSSEENYNINSDTQYRELYDKTDEITADFNKTTQALLDIKQDREVHWYTGFADAIKVVKNTVTGGISGIVGSIELGYYYIKTSVTAIDFPSYVVNILSAFLGIIIFFILFYVFTGRRP